MTGLGWKVSFKEGEGDLASGERRNWRRSHPLSWFCFGLADAQSGFGLARAAAPLQDVFHRLPEAAKLQYRHRRRTLLPAGPALPCCGSARDGDRRAAGKVGGSDGGGKDSGERLVPGVRYVMGLKREFWGSGIWSALADGAGFCTSPVDPALQ